MPDHCIPRGCPKCLPSEQEPVESASGLHAGVRERLLGTQSCRGLRAASLLCLFKEAYMSAESELGST